ncbi:hypothetical protein D3C80_1241270 [compost metagenome]
MRLSEERSRVAISGRENISTSIGVTAPRALRCRRSISSTAAWASQRANSTMVRPTRMAWFMMFMPAMWFMGSTTSSLSCARSASHSERWAHAWAKFRWLSMAPFGLPVVPEVYATTASSCPALRMAHGARPAARAAEKECMPVPDRGRTSSRTKSGMLR